MYLDDNIFSFFLKPIISLLEASETDVSLERKYNQRHKDEYR